MLYSSGTTGMPKGITRPFPNTPLEGTPGGVMPLLQLLFGMDDTKIYLSPAPFYHAAPLRFCLATHALGATIVAMEHFDPEEYLRLVEQHHVTHSQVVPTMFIRMLKLPEATRAAYDVSSLECVIHAAAPCPVPVKQQMIEWFGPVIHEYYAGSEGNGFVYCNSRELARPPRNGRVARSAASCTSSTRTATTWQPASRAPSTSRAAPSSSTTTTRRRRRVHATRRGGARSATSATSTTTGSCTSPIARPT